MTAKANEFRAKQQREAHPPKPKRPKRPRRDGVVDTSEPGVSASDRKVGAGHSAERNASTRVAKRGGPRLEDSATGKPSRKSTRKSAGHVDTTSTLRLKASRKTASPQARARRAKVKRKVR